MKDVSACEGRWCPIRSLCRRAQIHDSCKARDDWQHQSVLMIPRERQVRGMQCGDYLPQSKSIERRIAAQRGDA